MNDYIAEYADPEEENEDIQQEIQLFQNAMEFRSVKLRECMGPRNEIEAVKSTDSLAFARDRFEETKHSKLIVYEDNIDNIVGYIHLNDVIRETMMKHKMTIEKLVRPLAFFPKPTPPTVF